MKNRINTLFEQKNQGVLSVFFTAGYPRLEDTRAVLLALSHSGADLIEIGIPFSDPIADGGTIQQSSQQALDNGISLELIFRQLQDIRQETQVPLLMMGYLNPIMQYGIARFCADAQAAGIDGVILPDLPMAEYLDQYKSLFEAHGLVNIFLITPQTAPERIRQIDDETSGFIYVVSSDSTTGSTSRFGAETLAYFRRIREMKLRNPTLIGFGISDAESFEMAATYAQGAIVGSAFIKALVTDEPLASVVPAFVKRLKPHAP
ncbi:MAG: tryptophan synthase subunit alpha [Bacteroidia bacterium]|nr:tryptophan synthase subunit alpha [Bacteroidia bacterium]